jgi:hypothetical protein
MLLSRCRTRVSITLHRFSISFALSLLHFVLRNHSIVCRRVFLLVDGRANFLASALGIFFTVGGGLDFYLTFGLLGHGWKNSLLLKLSGLV